MKIAFHNIYQELNVNDFMFNNSDVGIGDNLLAPMIELKKYGNSLDLKIATTDIISVEETDAIVFIDMPKSNDPILVRAIKSAKPLYLLGFESPMINPESHCIENHKLFKTIFTWDDDLLGTVKSNYIKINFSHQRPANFSLKFSNNQKLCCLISGNKKVSYPNELYSERLKAIDWFEKNAPNDFDLYGVGWDVAVETVQGGNKYLNYLFRKSAFLKRILAKKYSSYKGRVERKKPVLQKYKFSLCYENASGLNGYITEKIFDCFFAGCVPIYWGADNIEKHIPKGCFVNKCNYDSYDELYRYLSNISDDEYKQYLSNIEKFVNSAAFEPFSIPYFAKTIINEISNEK